MDNFDPYSVLLVIATNIPVLLMTAFVLQGHILIRISLPPVHLLFKSVLNFLFIKRTMIFTKI